MFVFFEFFAPFFEKLWITHRNTAQIAARKPGSAPAETSMLDPACASSLTPLEDSGIRIGSWLILSIVWWFSKIVIAIHNEYLPVNQLFSPLVERQNLQKKELAQTRLTSGFAKNIHTEKECANNSPKAPKSTS